MLTRRISAVLSSVETLHATSLRETAFVANFECVNLE